MDETTIDGEDRGWEGEREIKGKKEERSGEGRRERKKSFGGPYDSQVGTSRLTEFHTSGALNQAPAYGSPARKPTGFRCYAANPHVQYSEFQVATDPGKLLYHLASRGGYSAYKKMIIPASKLQLPVTILH